jgi:hypothetical protein
MKRLAENSSGAGELGNSMEALTYSVCYEDTTPTEVERLCDFHELIPLFVILGLMLVCYGGLILLGDIESMSGVNQILPFILFLSLLWTGFNIVRKFPIMVWSPLLWFLGACALYFGFGPLVYYYGGESSILYADSFYAVIEKDIFRTNFLNTLCIAVILCVFKFGSTFFFRPSY